ncbi:uncharacterized protein VTP21DRAFT_6664 [Calcarisporiella thermophila]|uniref:uncharacterized protein n=1 Tax=Calcarisporiella thermophila TaxID=911321 RepID=UPI003742FFE3
MAENNSECTEVLDEKPRSILLGLISQLRLGMDLHRVTLPTFVLEPRSMLERISDFMSHPELILKTSTKNDPLERFIDVVRYYLSGWHIKPKGVKKPYNPVLGEIFRCRYKYNDGSEGIYFAEQVSHHPPISAYYYASFANNLVIRGDFRPKSKFLGNSAATIVDGISRIQFLSHPNEEYEIKMPNMYARGILFGTMVLELGDQSIVRCTKSDLVCEIDFKTKGFFSGTYNTIIGKIKRESTGETLYEISGTWSDSMFIRKYKSNDNKLLVNVHDHKVQPKIVAPEADQEERESRKLWSKVTKALLSRDIDLATDEKTTIEERQRKEARIRESEDIDWEPRFFYFDKHHDDYKFKLQHFSQDPKEAMGQLEKFIFSNSPYSSRAVGTINGKK